MKRSSTSLHFLASAAVTVEPAAISAMSLRPTSAYRGRGRNPGRNGRGFSNRPNSSDNEQFVTGDSHFQSVRDVNRGGGSYAGGNNNNRQPQPYRPHPPPPSFTHSHSPRFNQNQNQNQQFRSPGPPPRRPNFSGDQLPFRPPHLDRNQQFRPPPMYFNQNQQFRQPPPRQFRPPQQRSKPLDYRNWEYAKPGPPPSCERFSVLSYNILADYLAVNHRGKLYFHIPRHILDWEFRKRNIIFELGLWSADILCFQEVDRFQDFEEELQNRGYRGIWKMRTGDPVDGCAIFWRSSRFNLLHEESIEFNKLGLRDNVAQICVLESINQKNNIGMSALPASSEGRNKVVICNIHVLFNPKRGEIKLGQVRVLLDKAYAVSKLWDDAPVVVCGDFNCTPKSSLYNFISEQKLNVCELPRDKISGQASAEIRPRMPYTPTLRVIRQNGSLVDIQEKINIDSKSDDRPTSSVTQPRGISSAQNISNADENSAPLCKSLEGCDKDDDCKNEVLLTSHFPVNSSNLSTNGSPDEHTLRDIEKSRGEALATSTTSYSSSSGNSKSNCCTEDGRLSIEKDMDCNNSTVATDQSKPIDSSNSDVTSSEPILATSFREDLEAFPPENFKNLTSPFNNDKDPLSSDENEQSYDAKSTNFVVDETMESSPNGPGEATEDGVLCEDSTTYLSALQNTDAQLPSELVNCNDSPEELVDIPEILDDSSSTDDEPSAFEKPAYDPSAWTPMEIETATGSSECTFMEHRLMLRSTYSEVEDTSGTRDLNGEPQVTSYHRCFFGTVDYIWRTEGLQTVRVLAPIPKHAMQWTPGFPTKKWGSDHIALVTELAFTKDTDNQNAGSPVTD